MPSHVTGYLFAADPVTIVDPGPRIEITMRTWERALAAHGLALADVDQIVLTHQHWDHIGATADLHAVAHARVLAAPGVRPYLNDFGTAIGIEVEAYDALMTLHAVPGQLRQESLKLFGTLEPYVGLVDLDGELLDGDVLDAGGHALTIHARPGHSPTDTIFVDEEANTALLGDHLLADFPPVFMPTVPSEAPVDSGLLTMLTSLGETAALGLHTGLPAHGSAVADVAGTANRWAQFYRRRDGQILKLLGENGPVDAWQIAVAVHDEIRDDTAIYKLIAVLGALDVLESEGRVRREAGAGGVPVFSRG